MNEIKLFTYWLLDWYLVWGLKNILRVKKGLLLEKKELLFSLYFLLSILITILLFQKYLILINFIYLFFIVLSSMTLGYLFKNLKLDSSIFKSKNTYFLTIMPLNILYQQLMLIALIYILKSQTEGIINIIASLIFAAVHLPIIFFKWITYRYLYVIVALFLGCCFSSLIIYFQYGYLLSYLIHYLLYIGLSFWIKREENI